MLQGIKNNAGIIGSDGDTLRIIGDFSSVRTPKNHLLLYLQLG